MTAILEQMGMSAKEAKELPATEREEKFRKAFFDMMSALHPGMDADAMDRKRFGDLTFITVYDLRHPGAKKRQRKEAAAAARA
jgi:hypothetical protein